MKIKYLIFEADGKEYMYDFEKDIYAINVDEADVPAEVKEEAEKLIKAIKE